MNNVVLKAATPATRDPVVFANHNEVCQRLYLMFSSHYYAQFDGIFCKCNELLSFWLVVHLILFSI